MDNLVRFSSHPKIRQAVIYFGFNFPYYAEVLYGANVIAKKEVETAAMNVSIKGLNIYYNPEWFDKLSQAQVNMVLIHEIKHFIAEHPARNKSRDRMLSNICMDAIINSTSYVYEVASRPDFFDFPKNEKGENMLYFIPKEYDNKEIYELLYEWFQQKKQESKQKQNSQDDKDKKDGDNDKENSKKNQTGQGKPKKGKGNSKGAKGNDPDEDEGAGQEDPNGGGANGGEELSRGYGKNGKNGEMTSGTQDIIDNLNDMDDAVEAAKKWIEEHGFDKHLEDEVPQSMREAMVKDVLERIKARGLMSGDFEAMVKKLRPSKKNYLNQIRCAVSSMIGGKKIHTWLRDNKRSPLIMGARKVRSKINVLLDTSGSMGNTFEGVLSYVYHNGVEINLIETDSEVKHVQKVKSKYKLNGLKIKGLGGTALQPGVNLIKEKYAKYPTVILTDGYCDALDFKGYRQKTLILTTGDLVHITGVSSLVKQIKIEVEETAR